MRSAVAIVAILAVLLSPAGAGGGDSPLRLVGKWVLDAEGKPTPPDSFRRGLQCSGLLFRGGELWSVGDQRSEYPGHLFRIDPGTARLRGKPVRLVLPDPLPAGDAEFEAYRDIPNSDFEALAMDPKDRDLLLAVTESKVPWIAEIRLHDDGAHIERLSRIHFTDALRSWRDDPNYRFEGIAVSAEAACIYLAFERAADELPRICRLPYPLPKGPVEPEVVPFEFASVKPRADKPRALLNINDIALVRPEGRDVILAVLRDEERLLLLDPERRQIQRVIDLDLRDPDGSAIEWVSPEGIAVDPASDRLWLINDPDSERSNYRARGDAAPRGEYANYTPLLFEARLSSVLGTGPRGPQPPSGGGKTGK